MLKATISRTVRTCVAIPRRRGAIFAAVVAAALMVTASPASFGSLESRVRAHHTIQPATKIAAPAEAARMAVSVLPRRGGGASGAGGVSAVASRGGSGLSSFPCTVS